ncbi:MAG: hypothetical protein RR821_02645 [Clostridia bacterium]
MVQGMGLGCGQTGTDGSQHPSIGIQLEAIGWHGGQSLGARHGCDRGVAQG